MRANVSTPAQNADTPIQRLSPRKLTFIPSAANGSMTEHTTGMNVPAEKGLTYQLTLPTAAELLSQARYTQELSPTPAQYAAA